MAKIILSDADLSASRQGHIIASLVVTYTLAAIAVLLRFIARRLKRFSWWLDDWLILAALILALGWLVDSVVWVHYGVGRHYQALTLPYDKILYHLLLGLFIAEIFYTFVSALAKLSVIAFYWRLFKSIKSIRLPLWILTAFVLAWFIGRVITILLHCVPLNGYWDKSVDAKCTVNDRRFFMVTNTANVLFDVSLLLLPIPYINKLQVTKSQRLIIFGMFLFGGLICVSSVITTVVCFREDDKSPDQTWNIAPITLWAGVELNLAIVCACLPSLRPIYLLFRPSTSTKHEKSLSTYNLNGYGNNSMKNNADVFHVDGDPTGGVKNDIQVTTIISTHRESQTSTGKAKPPIKSQEIMKTVPQQTEKEIHQQTAVSRYSSGEFEDVAETPVNDVEKALPTKNDSTYNEVHDRAHLVPSSGAYQ